MIDNPPKGEPPSRADRLESQLRALRDVGLALESTMSFEDVLTAVVQRAARVMGAEGATLFVIEEGGALVSRVVDGADVREIRLSLGQGIAGWVGLHARPLIIPEAYADLRFDPSWDQQLGFTTRCVLACPVSGRGGRVIGVVEALNKIDGVFDADDLRLLELLAGQLASTIENSRLMVDLVEKNRALSLAKIESDRHNRELKLLLELERMVARSEDLETLAGAVLRRSLEITHAGASLLYRLDRGGAELRLVRPELGEVQVMRVDPGVGFAGWVAAKGEDVCLASPAGDPRYTGNLAQRIGIPLTNVAAVPLIASRGGPANGSLLVANKQLGSGFDDNDMALLRLVAGQLSSAIEHLAGREERERERRLATVGRLLAGVLHDLKSPITVISGYSELLAEKASDPEVRSYVENVNRALDRIADLAGEIIAFSRGERQVLLGSVSLESFVDRFVEQITPHLEAAGVTLGLHVRTGGTVRLDEQKLSRALHNIAINAVEAMPRGGRLTLEVDELGEEVVFSLTDTGPGIPDAIQGQVFESFVTLGKANGTGLGLSVAREIVAEHGGAISFTTAVGRGTTFLVTIPGLRAQERRPT